MKESDAIDIIKASLIDITDGEVNDKILTMYSKIILTNLLEEGMLPPVLPKEPLYYKSTGKELFQPTDYKWEKE